MICKYPLKYFVYRLSLREIGLCDPDTTYVDHYHFTPDREALSGNKKEPCYIHKIILQSD